MEGVTILQTIPQYASTWGWDPILILLGLVSVVAFVLAFLLFREDASSPGLACWVVGLLMAALTVCCASGAKSVFSHNQYQVLVEDAVSMTEFTNKYNVIEQQGITYIVEERVVSE